MEQVDLLRVMLPPLHQLDSGGGQAAWRSGTGDWQAAPYGELAELGARFSAKRVEVAPHPSDVSMTAAEMPALPPKRMRAAVMGAVELMALGGADSLAVGFGPRNSQGCVPMAWMSAEGMTLVEQALRRHGLTVSAVVPPPAFLPAPDNESIGRRRSPVSTVSTGSNDDSGDSNRVGSAINGEGDSLLPATATAVAMRVGDWAVLRTGPHDGLLQPLPPGQFDQTRADERLRALLPEGGKIGWIAAGETPTGVGLAGDVTWTLPMGKGSGAGTPARWIPAAVGWSVAIAAVWAVGLNLQAARMAEEGKALRRQMATQVKTAFPEVSVVLNPLQQARQLREAQRAGTGTLVSTDAAGLLRASTMVLTQAEGQVQQLQMRDGQLQVLWRDGHSLGQDEIQALQASARARGLLLQPDARGVRIQVDPAQASPVAPSGAQVADVSATTGAAGVAATAGTARSAGVAGTIGAQR